MQTDAIEQGTQLLGQHFRERDPGFAGLSTPGLEGDILSSFAGGGTGAGTLFNIGEALQPEQQEDQPPFDELDTIGNKVRSGESLGAKDILTLKEHGLSKADFALKEGEKPPKVTTSNKLTGRGQGISIQSGRAKVPLAQIARLEKQNVKLDKIIDDETDEFGKAEKVAAIKKRGGIAKKVKELEAMVGRIQSDSAIDFQAERALASLGVQQTGEVPVSGGPELPDTIGESLGADLAQRNLVGYTKDQIDKLIKANPSLKKFEKDLRFQFQIEGQ